MPSQRIPAGRGQYRGQNAYVGQNDSYSFRRDKVKKEGCLYYGSASHGIAGGTIVDTADFGGTELLFFPLCSPSHIIRPTTVRIYLAKNIAGASSHKVALYVANFELQTFQKLPESEFEHTTAAGSVAGPDEHFLGDANGFTIYPEQAYFLAGITNSAHAGWGGIQFYKYAMPGDLKKWKSTPSFAQGLPGMVKFTDTEDDSHVASDTFPFVTYITEKGKLVV